MQSEEAISFILVHGAYHGGWCWEGVSKLLKEKGYQVFAPTLTGLSERRDSLTPQVTLDTHVKDIVDLALSHDLENVHLVGWSYGGMVITGVLGAIPERITSMTYLDAHLPEDNRSAASYLSGMERFLLKFAALLGQGLNAPNLKNWGMENELAKEVSQKLSPQPARTFTQPVTAPEPWPAHVCYSYIRCIGYAGSIFDQFYAKAVKDSRFKTTEIESSHGAVHTHPAKVTDAIIGV